MAGDRALDVATRALAASKRNPDAFGLVFEELWPEVVGRLARATRSREAARDLAAEAFAKALQQAHRFDPKRGNAMQWVWGIARHELVAWHRRGVAERTARTKLGLTTTPPAEPDVDGAVGTSLDAVASAFGGLSSAERRVVALRLLDEHSYASIAAALGCSPTAARARYSRAMAKLRAEVARSLGAPGHAGPVPG